MPKGMQVVHVVFRHHVGQIVEFSHGLQCATVCNVLQCAMWYSVQCATMCNVLQCAMWYSVQCATSVLQAGLWCGISSHT